MQLKASCAVHQIFADCGVKIMQLKALEKIKLSKESTGIVATLTANSVSTGKDPFI